MGDLVDFLPVEAAAWLELRVFDGSSIRVIGPPGAGRTRFLATLADVAGGQVSIAGLSSSREGLACLRGRDNALQLIIPALLERRMLGDVPDLLLRQAIRVTVADEPDEQTWPVLADIQTAGVAVWVGTSSTAGDRFEADVSVRLGHQPGDRVELITDRTFAVYWVDGDGSCTFQAPTSQP